MAVRRMLVAGRYRLHEPVGTGGMGRVWMARDEMLDRDVAVKEFVPPVWMTDDEKDRLRDRTLREARSAARLNHPHVVRIYDVVHAEGLPWIVMEYVPSRSLHQVIAEDGPLTPEATARIGLNVLSALTAAHRAGVLHRDVKPHNVLIGHDGRVVLTDFGLATFVDDGSVTGPGLVVGSPQYVSPERARDGASTVESDLWSLGATLYAAVEGRTPYARESAMATLMALATEPPDPPVLSGPLTPVLTGLLRYEPSERLTHHEVEEKLRAVVGGQRTDRPRVNGRAAVPAQRAVDGGPQPKAMAEMVATPERVSVRNAAPVNDVKPVLRHTNRPPAAVQSGGAHTSPAPAPRKPAKPVATTSEPAAVPTWPISAPPVAAGARRDKTRLTLLVLLIVALLGTGGMVLGTVLQRDAKDQRQTGPLASPARTPSGSGAAIAGPGGFSALVCAGEPATDLPRTPQPGASRINSKNGYALYDGYSIYTDPVADFRLAVPDGWTYERIGTTVCFRDPNNVRMMSLESGRNPKGDPVTACRRERDRLLKNDALPGYEEIGITAEPLSIKAAEWEFTYKASADTRMHAATRWFVNSGRGFALSWTTREFDWSGNLSNFRMIQTTFIGTK